jgi:hypothetical protein
MLPANDRLPTALDVSSLSDAQRARLLEVLDFAAVLCGDRKRAAELLRSEPIRVLGGLTALELVRQDRALDVLQYLQSISGGASG